MENSYIVNSSSSESEILKELGKRIYSIIYLSTNWDLRDKRDDPDFIKIGNYSVEAMDLYNMLKEKNCTDHQFVISEDENECN